MQINKKLTPYNHYNGRGGQSIKYIVIHYVGALGDAEANCNYYASGDVGASAHYYVDFDGTVWQSVEDSNGAWSVGGGLQGNSGASLYGQATNYNTLNIEMCVRKHSSDTMNATDKDWYFEDATVLAAIELTKYLMQKHNIPVDRVIRHYDVNGKICPNPYVYNHTKHTWDGFKTALKDVPAPEDIWLGWTKYESGTAGFKQTGGDSGKAWGKYQFDYRYGLVPFMQSCVDYNPSRYAGFKPFIALKAGNARLPGNKDLTALWGKYCTQYAAEFEDLQDKAAMTDYYKPVRLALSKVGIDLDNHDPAVRGSAFSMAIRSGSDNAAARFKGCKDSDSDRDILQHIYGTYGQEDAGRWPRQLADALAVLKSVTPSTPAQPDTIGSQYRVQAGSYKDKKLANSHAAVLKAAGFDCIVKLEDGLHKVQCGVFADKGKADSLVKQIVAAGYDAIVKADTTCWVGKCIGDKVNVRKGPGISYGMISGYPQLSKGNLVDVTAETNGWYQVLIAKKHIGYVSARYIERV